MTEFFRKNHHIIELSIRETEEDVMGLSGKKKLLQLLKIASVTLGVYIIFKYMLPVILPFVLAYALCRFLYPAACLARRKIKLPVGIAGTLLVTITGALALAVFYAGGSYIFGQIRKLIVRREQYSAAAADIFYSICRVVSNFTGISFENVSDHLGQWLGQMITVIQEHWFEILKDHGFPVIRGIAAFGIVFAVALLAGALLIKNKEDIDRHLKQSEFFWEISEITAKLCKATWCFFRSQCIIITLVAVVCSIGLKLAGSEYAVLTGIVIALLDALPVIGSGTILIPWAIIDIFIGNYKAALILAVVYALCAALREVLEAKLMGNSMGVNEFYMLAATFIGMNLFGLWGIILGPVGLVLILELLRQLKERYKM